MSSPTTSHISRILPVAGLNAARRYSFTALMLGATVVAAHPAEASTISASHAAGQVFSFGSNSSGATGLGTDVGDTTVATAIDTTNLAGRQISQVAVGGSYNLLLDEDGTVFSFGFNLGGRTGQGTSSGATLVATAIDATNLAGQTITQVAAGGGHGLLLADNGSVFSFGFNSVGRTGQGTTSGSTLVATEIDTTNLTGRTITQVAGGGLHSLLLADDGSAFAFGNNANGRTGLGASTGDTTVATAIDTTNLAGRTITQIAAGGHHSLLLADDSSVFAFGNNSFGATGLGTSTGDTTVATEIDTTNLAGRTITQIAAGDAHSLLLTDDGTVFSFGWNLRGRTGLGTGDGLTTVATEIDTTNLAGRTITQITAGDAHSLLLADDGSVFSFGWNLGGQTGLGTSDGDTLIATMIEPGELPAGSFVTDLAAGTHSLLVAIPEPASAVLLAVGGLVLLRRPAR